MIETIDWVRVRKALYNSVGYGGKECEGRVERAARSLPKILEKCGEFSRTRKMAFRIGRCLLGDRPTVLVPSCPDYSYTDGRYTFNGLGGGVSLLAEKHIAFLQEITPLLDNPDIIILYADHEADDPELLKVTRKTKEEFDVLVESSIRETAEYVGTRGWLVLPMTEAMPTLIQDEQRIFKRIIEDPESETRISTETAERSQMYQRINMLFTWEEKVVRTVKTASQYVALGEYAAANGYLVCNHTTTNLNWYLKTGAGVLHNAVSVY